MAEIGLVRFGRLALEVSQAVLPDRAKPAAQEQHTRRPEAPPLQGALESERLFAWMHNFRRLVTRWEYTSRTSLASSSLPVSICYSNIYETASRLRIT
jgi:hypothetical protein